MIRLDRFGIRSAQGCGILSPLSLLLPDGSSLFVAGGSGSGKTSLLEAIAGVSRHACTGTLEAPPALLAPQEAGFSFGPYRRVGPQLQDGLAGAALTDYRQRLSHLLSILGLAAPEAKRILPRRKERLAPSESSGEHVLEHFPHELSGGMLKRVLIAGVLARAPVLALFDEPTAGIDYSRRWDVMRAIRESGSSFIVATHDPELVRSAIAGEWLLVLRDGESVAFGPARHVLLDPPHPYVHALLGPEVRA